jgi:hypothetical protein
MGYPTCLARAADGPSVPFPLQLARKTALPLKNVRFFVLDECDKMLEKLGASMFCMGMQRVWRVLADMAGAGLALPAIADQYSVLPSQTCARTAKRSLR